MVGFDDADWTSVVSPPISVVAQPTHARGRRPAELLLARIAGDESPPELTMMTTDILARGSMAPRPTPTGAPGSPVDGSREYRPGDLTQGSLTPRLRHARQGLSAAYGAGSGAFTTSRSRA